MQVFYTDVEQAYGPRHSFFYGRFTPYPEVPGRTRSILEALAGRAEFQVQAPPALDEAWLERAHSRAYLDALAAVCARLKPDEEFFPFHMQRLPALLRSPHARLRAGYYALDGSTPLMAESYRVATAVAATAVAGAQAVLEGAPLAYALPRPPGHHAGRESWCGYCLVNNAAVAAHGLLERGKVAIVDVDYHHGNGTQEIFWERDDVFYASLHCRPEEAYPYVAGTADETGGGRGQGANLNLPLPGGTDWATYAPALETALEAITRFDPATVVVSLGFDALATDPIGTFRLQPSDFEPMARSIAQLGRPLLVIQEGGYDVPRLGECALAFFAGLGQPGAQHSQR
ncbi:MAG TPA: histone deacetylase family protein [bacterium]|nr:histone deacetylase family protein [bacterium]